MKISFRLNKEYDADIINELTNLKKENLSKKIRQILRDYFMKTMSDKSDKTIKWNFPKEENKK